jgi:bifunctional DNA-binding transcriptional regulator/antitoxin component of YhaV-PrlF toxin-antitoxin module
LFNEFFARLCRKELAMNEVIQISLDEIGDLLIPPLVRERLRLSPGMTLVVEKGERGGVRLRVQEQQTSLVEKDGILVARVAALSDLSDVTRHEREQRVFNLLQRESL